MGCKTYFMIHTHVHETTILTFWTSTFVGTRPSLFASTPLANNETCQPLSLVQTSQPFVLCSSQFSWFQLCNKKCFIGLVNLDQIPQIFSNLQNQNKQSYKSIQPKGTTLNFFFATSKVFKTKPNSYYIEKQ
jgi:hypothetical protein